MKASHLTTALLFCMAASTACSSFPDRPGSLDQGSGGYATARNQACLLDAERAWQFGNLDEVERALARWQGPMQSERPLAMLARVAFARSNFGYSAELFTKALEFDPESVALITLAGQAHEAAGNPTAASKQYARALELSESQLPAAVGLLRTRITLSEGEQALAFAARGMEYFGTDAEFVTLAADLAFFEGDYSRAIAWTRIAETLDAVHSGGQERLILALAWTGQHAEALVAAKSTDSEDRSPEVDRALGRSALALGQGAQAALHFQHYLSSRSEGSEGWMDLARAQFLAGSTEQALVAVNEAARRNASDASVQLLRAHCLFQLGQDESAVKAYEASIALGADPAGLQPFLDLLVMRDGNSLQPQPASSAKGTALPSPE